MIRLTIEASGVIYRNPLPGHRVINAYYPMVLPLGGNELICVLRIAQAIYAPGATLEIFRSSDGGNTWQRQGPLIDRAKDLPTYSYSDAYLTRLGDGSLVLRAGRWNFVSDDQFAFNGTTNGLSPIEVCYLRSTDEGRTWSAPVVADFSGAFEANLEPAPQGGILELPDGAWMQVWETWKPYNDAGPFHLQSYALVSRDGGCTWGERVTMASGEESGRSYSHGIPVRLEDGRFFASLWTAESQLQTSYDVHTVTSLDTTGRSWSEPRSTGIPGQTSCTADLGGGRMLIIFSHREGTEQPGIKVASSEDAGITWNVADPLVVWDAYGKEALGVARSDTYPSSHDNISYGAPKIIAINGSTALASFWCSQGGDTHSRWCRIHVE